MMLAGKKRTCRGQTPKQAPTSTQSLIPPPKPFCENNLTPYVNNSAVILMISLDVSMQTGVEPKKMPR